MIRIINQRFNVATSYVILSCLVTISSGIIWFALQAYSEIDQIASTMPIYDEYVVVHTVHHEKPVLSGNTEM